MMGVSVKPRRSLLLSYLRRGYLAGALCAIGVSMNCSSDSNGPSPLEDAAVVNDHAEAAIPMDAGSAIDASGPLFVDERSSPEGGDADGEMGSEGPSSDGSSACSAQSTNPAHAGSIRSAGFAGTDTAYFALYDVVCQTVADCSSACVAAGGTTNSCAMASDCIAEGVDGGMNCLPPTYWRNLGAGLSESETTTNAAELTLVTIPYQDALVFTGFSVALPDDATILGIRFMVRKNADDGFAVDDSVHVLRDGAAVGLDRSQTDPWPQTLTYVTYGGPSDTWGVPWRLQDIRSSGFGLAIAPRFTGAAGNDRAHIESVRVTIFYRSGCD